MVAEERAYFVRRLLRAALTSCGAYFVRAYFVRASALLH